MIGNHDTTGRDRSVLVAILAATILSVSFYLIHYDLVEQELMPAAMVLIGGTFMLFIDSSLAFLKRGGSQFSNDITYDRSLVSLYLKRVSADKARARGIAHFKRRQESDNHEKYRAGAELSAWQLLHHDRSLALAKVRLDIESIIREIAELAFPGGEKTHRPTVRIVQDLSVTGHFDTAMQDAILEILKACTQALHGQYVSAETAEYIIENAEQLRPDILEILNSVRAEARIDE
jgi:hypothetical protein